MRLCVAATVPSVDPDDTVTDMADVTDRDTTAPLVKVEDRKSKVVGSSVTVSALADTVAVIGLIAGSANLVSPTLSIRSSIQVFVCKVGSGVTTTSCANQTGTPVPQVGYQVRIWKESDYPSGPILGVGLTKSNGSYTFNSLDAPLRYVIEVTNVPGSPALTSQTVTLGASSTQIIGLLTP